MPGAQDRKPGDPNRPSVGEVGEELQEEVDAEEAKDNDSSSPNDG